MNQCTKPINKRKQRGKDPQLLLLKKFGRANQYRWEAVEKSPILLSQYWKNGTI